MAFSKILVTSGYLEIRLLDGPFDPQKRLYGTARSTVEWRSQTGHAFNGGHSVYRGKD